LYVIEDEIVFSIYKCATKKESFAVNEAEQNSTKYRKNNHDFECEKENTKIGLFDSEMVLNVLIDSTLERCKIAFEIKMIKSWLSELNLYFKIFLKPFQMTCNYLQTCVSFLPLQLCSPFTFSMPALTSYCLIPAIEVLEKNNFFKNVPSNMFQSLKCSQAFSVLQRKIRKKFGSKECDDGSKLRNGSIIITDNVIENGRFSVVDKIDKTVKKKRETIDSTDQLVNNNIQKNEFFLANRCGLQPKQKKQALETLDFILSPLNTFFVQETIKYVLNR
jgi:hypothetical protein